MLFKNRAKFILSLMLFLKEVPWKLHL